MHHKKPVPLCVGAVAAPVCPVCGQRSYSRAGIHPQCAQQRADDAKTRRIQAGNSDEKPKKKEPSPMALNPWHKRCPKCSSQVHIRKIVCDCGHRFR